MLSLMKYVGEMCSRVLLQIGLHNILKCSYVSSCDLPFIFTSHKSLKSIKETCFALRFLYELLDVYV